MNQHITTHDWYNIRSHVKDLNPELASLIDELSPDKKHELIEITYPYGSEILKSGHFQLPDEKGLLSRLMGPTSEYISLQKKLGYNAGSNPVGLILNNTAELFIELPDRIIPYSIFEPGYIFGFWKVLDSAISHCPPVFNWGLTAGARSLFMLPGISDTIANKRLYEHFGVSPKSYQLKDLREHWSLFSRIIKQSDISPRWETRILFFSGTWFEQLEDPLWKNFYNYLLKKAWKSSEFWRNQYIWNLTFTRIQKNRQLKINGYLFDLLKQLFMIAVTAVPGFGPATDNRLAPIDFIQAVYDEIYQLKLYHPTLMQPTHFDWHDKASKAYFSMSYPCAIELSPRFGKRISRIDDLKQMKSLTDEFLEEIASGHLNIDTTPLAMIPHHVEFSFFNNDSHKHHGLIDNQLIPLQDPAFCSSTMDKGFAADANFCRNCIRLSSTKK